MNYEQSCTSYEPRTFHARTAKQQHVYDAAAHDDDEPRRLWRRRHDDAYAHDDDGRILINNYQLSIINY